jgi:uncharacterized protein YkwD
MKLRPGQRVNAAGGMALVGFGFTALVLLVTWVLVGCADDAPSPTPDVVYVYVCPSPTPKIVPPPLPTRDATGIVPPAPVPSAVSTAQVPTAVPTAALPPPPPPLPTGVPTGVPTRTLLNAVAQHDGTTPLFGPPCWSNSKRNPATCTPTVTPLPADTATATPIPTDTPMPPPPTNTATATPTAAPGTPSATPTPHWTQPPPAVLAEEETMRQLINQHRVSIGLHALLHIEPLDRAQRWWAYDMIAANDCYHGDYGWRALQMGYAGFAWGEAGACGYPNAAEAFQGWLDSPGHRGIVEAVRENEFGVGAWQYPNGYWQHWLLVGCGHTLPCPYGGQPEP